VIGPARLSDLERLAAARLPTDVWDFIQGGSGDECTMAANRAALDAVGLIPRVLTGHATATTRCRLLGTEADMPVAVAPMAYQRLVHTDGELAVARATKAASVPFIISTLSSVPLEDIAAVGGPTWFQLYWLRDRARVMDLVTRAEQAGCQALVVTVDVPIMGRRPRDVQNQFALPPEITAANLAEPSTAISAHERTAGTSALATHTKVAFHPRLTWSDIGWLRERTSLPVVLKGILDPQDATRAAESGADAIVVSNHGGRQLDGAIPAIRALPAIAEATNGNVEILFDSGIRSGTDVLRALALGATGVLLGRPTLWGLATDGETGTALVLSLLRDELTDALTLSGCANVTEAKRLSTTTH
jgi:4-hydroxymandelate oxidase